MGGGGGGWVRVALVGVIECRTAEALKPVQKNRNHKLVFNIMRGTKCRSVVQRPVMVRWVTGSLTMNPLTYFSFQPCSTTYVTKIVVCAILMWSGAYKRTLSAIRRSTRSGGSGFPLKLSEISFTICPTSYNYK